MKGHARKEKGRPDLIMLFRADGNTVCGANKWKGTDMASPQQIEFHSRSKI